MKIFLQKKNKWEVDGIRFPECWYWLKVGDGGDRGALCFESI